MDTNLQVQVNTSLPKLAGGQMNSPVWRQKGPKSPSQLTSLCSPEDAATHCPRHSLRDVFSKEISHESVSKPCGRLRRFGVWAPLEGQRHIQSGNG